ncbi:hypothetical protein B0H11DRAFT_572236 [Mycena galericulata]|nr:hypothetical protein B0H11DRAFT_572236 [Mycena galericulata]
MLNKLVSTAILFLALANASLALSFGPGPVKLQCGGYDDPPCASGDLCCGSSTGIGNYCQPAALLCRELNPPTK